MQIKARRLRGNTIDFGGTMPTERRSRPDRATATTVDAGIALMDSLGRYAAAQYLLVFGVRFPVSRALNTGADGPEMRVPVELTA